MVVLRFSAAFTLLFFATALGRGLLEVQQIKGAISLKKTQEQVKDASSLKNKEEQYYWHQFVVNQRRLIGPGSFPPTCRARCGRCFPCKPVRVVIQPGLSIPLEYYPEAWRCKCGNKLFMP